MVVAVSQQLGNLDFMATEHCENPFRFFHNGPAKRYLDLNDA
jgi:hypothetical protein